MTGKKAHPSSSPCRHLILGLPNSKAGVETRPSREEQA